MLGRMDGTGACVHHRSRLRLRHRHGLDVLGERAMSDRGGETNK